MKKEMENYEEMNREDFPENTEIPVAQVSEEEADRLLPAEKTEEEENYLYIPFGKPYNFEGTTYESIDLSGLDDVNGRKLTAIEKAFGKSGIVSSMPETTATYAKIAAVATTGLPAEFFEDLPGKEVRKIKTAVTRFFYEED